MKMDELKKKAEAAEAAVKEGAELADDALDTVAGGQNYQYDQYQVGTASKDDA